jgi:integrase
MGYVRKEKNGTWTVCYDRPVAEGRGATTKRGFPLRGDALRYLARVETAKADGTLSISTGVTLVSYVDMWLEREYKAKYRSGDKKPKTYLFYKGIFAGHFRSFFGNDLLQKITPRRIEDYLAYLGTVTGSQGKPLAKNTVRKHYEALRTLLRYAVKHRDLATNPLDPVDPPKREAAKIAFWEPEVIPQALALFAGSVIEWHVKLALLTGLREGEICGLHEGFIDFKKKEFFIREQCQVIEGEGLIFLDPKTEESRTSLPLTPEIEELLRARIIQNKKNRLMYGVKYSTEFVGRLSVGDDGRMIRPQFVYRNFRRTLEAQTEVPAIRFHDMRHTCAVWHVAMGTDMKTLQRILRHSDYCTTANLYADSTLQLKAEAMARLSLK